MASIDKTGDHGTCDAVDMVRVGSGTALARPSALTRRIAPCFCGALLAVCAIRDAALGGDDRSVLADTVEAWAGEGAIAAIPGKCDELVVGSRIIPSCDDMLLGVEFRNGRVAFMFAGRVHNTTVVTILSGARSIRPDANRYELTVDRLSAATLADDRAPDGSVTTGTGTCAVRRDAARKAARFECRVRSAGGETIVRFRSAERAAIGAPAGAGDSDPWRWPRPPRSRAGSTAARRDKR